jgi:hypothetical protein
MKFFEKSLDIGTCFGCKFAMDRLEFGDESRPITSFHGGRNIPGFDVSPSDGPSGSGRGDVLCFAPRPRFPPLVGSGSATNPGPRGSESLSHSSRSR